MVAPLPLVGACSSCSSSSSVAIVAGRPLPPVVAYLLLVTCFLVFVVPEMVPEIILLLIQM